MLFNKGSVSRTTYLLIIVASLGYFVDIYDLVLFNVIKKASLETLQLSGEKNEITLFNWQMTGMMLGGIFWGILGDKKGRLSVLFGSILLYSLANIANAFVNQGNINAYSLIRFFAGLGLAGELGAGITLVVEMMSKENRGYGTMIIVAFGALGAVFASFVGSSFTWQMAYIVGGILGILLLVLRIGTMESTLFKQLENNETAKGNFTYLFSDKKIFLKYLKCILIGLPIWYVVGILISLSVGITKQLGIEGVVTASAIMYSYIGLSAGDLLSGLLSQLWKSRKKVVITYLLCLSCLVILFLFPVSKSLTWFYIMCFLLGAGTGFWALFVTIASEQFGTNIRSTVTNTAPNFVRGSLVLITLLYKFLEPFFGDLNGKIYSALIVGGVCITISFISIVTIEETFGKDLDYLEL